jgi:hypothetical protein
MKKINTLKGIKAGSGVLIIFPNSIGLFTIEHSRKFFFLVKRENPPIGLRLEGDAYEIGLNGEVILSNDYKNTELDESDGDYKKFLLSEEETSHYVNQIVIKSL